MDVVREGQPAVEVLRGAVDVKARMMSSVLGMFRLMVSKRGEQGAREAKSVRLAAWELPAMQESMRLQS
jgi:hypothetical protein